MVEHTGGIVGVERLHVMDPRQLKVLKDKTKVLEAYPDFAPGSRTDEGVCKLIELFCKQPALPLAGNGSSKDRCFSHEYQHLPAF